MANTCSISGINLSFDKNDKIKTIIEELADGNQQTLEEYVAILQDPKLINYLKDNITSEANGVKIENRNDFVNIPKATLKKQLREYKIAKDRSVDSYGVSEALTALSGFTSGQAKYEAATYNAVCLIQEYRAEQTKSKNKRRSPEELIADVNSKLLNTLVERTISMASIIKSDSNISEQDKKAADEILNFYKQLDRINYYATAINNAAKELNAISELDVDNMSDEEYEEVNRKYSSIEIQYNSYKQEYDKIINSLSIDNSKKGALKAERYMRTYNFVFNYAHLLDEVAAKRFKNFANLVCETRSDPNWYFQVFNSKQMIGISKDFSKIDNFEEFIENQDDYTDDDVTSSNDMSIDETSKNWSDAVANNFMQTVSNDVKIILSTLPQLSSPYNPQNARNEQNFDTNNELGVTTYMDVAFTISQLYSFGNFASVDAFIASIEKKSNEIKELYGLGQLVADMKRDRVLANRMFSTFAKPIMHKTMITISNYYADGGITFDYNNEEAFPLASMVFKSINTAKAIYDKTYNVEDYNLVKQILRNGFNDRDVKNLYNILHKYLPNITNAVYDKYIDYISTSINNGNKAEADLMYSKLVKNVLSLIEEYGRSKDNLNKEIERVKQENHNNYIESRKNKTKYEKQYVDYNSVFTDSLYNAIIKLSEIFTEFSPANIRLNTPNGEGNTNSNVLKTSYLGRFIEQVQAGTEEDVNAGLKAMLEYITQGIKENGYNQYQNNPLLFGVKDETGRIIAPGLFIQIGDTFSINPNVNPKELINVSLFDGIKNTTGEGTVYSKMTKLDFFISQYIAFNRSIKDIQNDKKTDKVTANITNQFGSTTPKDFNTAVYPMMIGSDAPKIFFIKSLRYDYTQCVNAIYQHILNEINTMALGFNAIFKYDEQSGNFILKDPKDKKNLIDRIHYNGDIIENGKLTGKAFDIFKIEDLDSKDAERQYKSKLMSLLSLYGGVDTKSIFETNEFGVTIFNKQHKAFKVNSLTNKIEFNIKDNNLQNAIKEIVENYCKDFINTVKEDLSTYIEILKENENLGYDEKTFNSYILNTLNMNFVYDDIFNGGFKYYKSSRDLFKRLKEVITGGESYAGYDILESDKMKIHNLEDDNIQIYDGNKDDQGNPTKTDIVIEGKTLKPRTGFRAITIYNTVRASDQVGKIYDTVRAAALSQGKSEEVADKLALGIAQGFGGRDGKGNLTKINDAQSYITLEEFIRRKYNDGTLYEYSDLLRQLLDPDIPAEEIDLNDVSARIQVQKNFYYDIQFDDKTGMFYPRQIKNAEFVLIPKLLPENSDLRKVYDFMVANDIGQLNTAETSKAAKRNILTIWDKETGEFNEKFEEDYKKYDSNNQAESLNDYVEEYKYKYLHKQQDVVDHIRDEKNKAGSQISKKILDNIINEILAGTENRQELVKLAKEYEDAYVANIKENFEDLLYSLNWKYDTENQRIINREYATTDEFGNKLSEEEIEENKTRLNLTNIYARAREEAIRIGMDNNFLEYLMPNEFGVSPYPLTSNVMFKLESVAQAIYNNHVTRQEWSGWHATQITNVGYSKDKNLEFNAEEGIMDVYLPRWSNLIPKGKTKEEEEAILKQLEEEGLVIQLAYRIPTEGKQSISRIRVKGFTHEALGSTIVVPEEWVTQTGSDFDVDSVYGISWEMYRTKDKNGNIIVKKVPYDEETFNKNEEFEYARYVQHQLNIKFERENVGKVIKEKRKEASKIFEDYKREYRELDNERNNLYDSLPKKFKDIIIDTNKLKDKTLYDKYIEISDKFNTQLNKSKDKLTEEELNIVNEYHNKLLALMQNMDKFAEAVTNYEELNRTIREDASEEVKQRFLNSISLKAKENDLMSFDEWNAQPFVNKLSSKARNNYILDRMIRIMNDPNSRIEQYGQSTFADIVNGNDGANDYVDSLYGINKNTQNPYNPVTQLNYMEDAMGGAKLKARSVMWDTFISRCNKSRVSIDRTKIPNFIFGNETHQELLDSKEELKKRYDKDEIEFNDKDIVFRPHKIGWTYDNYNLIGKLLTSYTAQTTAHHLDAIKEGSIPNVNDYTFSAYKLLTCLGLDFKTTILFIRQPIITELVNTVNASNSLYVSNDSYPIASVIKNIAKKAGLKVNGKEIDKYTKYADVFTEVYKYIYGQDVKGAKIGDLKNNINDVNVDKLVDNIKQFADNKTTDIKTDFETLIIFERLLNLSKKVEKYINCSNVDKTGAKPTIWESRRLEEDIQNLMGDDTLTIDVNNAKVNFAASLFGEIDASPYKSSTAAYKYSLQSSIATNSQMFITETDEYHKAEKYIEDFIGRNFNIAEYKEYRRYALTYMYNYIEKLFTPTYVNEKGKINAIPINDNFREETYEREKARILGYASLNRGALNIKDNNKPTNEELISFSKLTPAEKVLYIQKTFDNNPGIFGYINVTTLNEAEYKRKGISRQYLRYNDQIYNSDTLFNLFKNAFNNKNSLIKMAAIDLIKYAYVAEGFNYKSGYITRLIPNSVIYGDPKTSFYMTNELNTKLKILPDLIQDETFSDSYIRSHSEVLRPKTLSVKDTNIVASRTRQDGMIIIDGSIYENSNETVRNLFEDLINIRTMSYSPNTDKGVGYTKVIYKNKLGNNYKTTEVIYKVIGYGAEITGKGIIASYKYMYMIPMNKLDKTETLGKSYNINNDMFYDLDSYEELIKVHQENTLEPIPQRSKYISSGVNEFIDWNDVDLFTKLMESENNQLSEMATKISKHITDMINPINNPNNTPNLLITANPIFNTAPNKFSLVINGIKVDLVKLNTSNPKFNIDSFNNASFVHKQLANSKSTIDKFTTFRFNVSNDPITMNSITGTIQDVEEDLDIPIVDLNNLPRRESDNIDRVSMQIYDEISYASKRKGNDIANSFVEELAKRGFNPNSTESISSNREDLYEKARIYYVNAANAIISSLNKFTINGVDYTMDSDELYKALIENEEYFTQVANIILDGITFGNRISDIFKLDLTAEDEKLKKSIEGIINAINSVRQNTKLNKALDKIFNIYFKRYSTNPDIKIGILELREAFGDLDVVDSWINSPNEIENPQVQVVLKKVFSIFNKAQLFDAQENVDEWNKQIKEIEALEGSMDLSHLIDFDKFMLKTKYTPEFEIERQKVIDEYNEAIYHRDDYLSYEDFINQQNYSSDYIENNKDAVDREYNKAKYQFEVNNYLKYLNAKYRKDWFMWKNTNQYIVDDYYVEDLNNRNTIFNAAPQLYAEYMYLKNKLYRINPDTATEEQLKERQAIISKLTSLTSPYDFEGKNKQEPLYTQVLYLKQYIDNDKQIKGKYFESKEYEGFYDTYLTYKKFIENYDKHNFETTLTEKLENPKYAEAYNWIKSNGKITFTKAAFDKIKEKYDLLGKKVKTFNYNEIEYIKTNFPEAVDKYGEIDPRQLTKEQIAILKQKELDRLSSLYYENMGVNIEDGDSFDRSLITASNIKMPILRKRANSNYNTESINAIRKGIYNVQAKINAIVVKARDKNTGKINPSLLFNDKIITNEERNDLIKYYNSLRVLNDKLKNEKEKIFENKGFPKNKKPKVTVKIDNTATSEFEQFAETNLKGTAAYNQFEKLCWSYKTKANAKTGQTHLIREYNEYLFGYVEFSKSLIDEEATEAREWIDKNLTRTETEYYRQAKLEAERKSAEEYNQWFKENHVYDPYLRRYKPLDCWTELTPVLGGELAGEYKYEANFNVKESKVKDQYLNKSLYNPYGDNYNTERGQFNSGLSLTEKENKMRDLIITTMNKFANTNKGKRFVGQGYLPRERKTEVTPAYVGEQALALLGLSWHSGSDSDVYHETVDYTHDSEIENDMLRFIVTKDTKNYKRIPLRGTMSDKEYTELVTKIRKENEEIAKHNEAIDNANINRNFKEVMEHFIYNSTINNSRQQLKPYLYLLLEDLKRNQAYQLNGLFNRKPAKDKKLSTDRNIVYKKVDQNNTRELVHELTRRLLFSEYHKNSTPRQVANFLQNMTSAKYMVFNLYGGIANVATGMVNIEMERIAGEYFGDNEFRKAQAEYLSNIHRMVTEIYSDTASNLATALIKQFNIVDFDQMLQVSNDLDNISGILKKFRNFTYSFQSIGEHYMQNSVFLAMLNSNRLYTDADGIQRIGDFKDFTQSLENIAMRNAIKDNHTLTMYYNDFLIKTKYDAKDKYKVVSNKIDINRKFLYSIRDLKNNGDDTLYRSLVDKYNKEREKLLKTAKEEFNKGIKVKDLYEFKDGLAVLKQSALNNFSANNPAGDLKSLIAEFKEKVIMVNQKIHGIYDKNGAARLESKWYGSLVMQYHKHLLTGILKRYRRKGYYNEFRGSREVGAYQTLANFLGIEFTNFKERVKNNAGDDGSIALESVKLVLQATINTLTHAQLNYSTLSRFEKANLKRNLGDLAGILSAMLFVALLYAGFDDDEIKDSGWKSSLLYLSDRLYSDSSMYTPIGLVSEYKTAWSSPIASANGPSDLIKAITMLPKALFDPNFDPIYKTGQYRGQNKFEVLLRRNLPGIRPYDRIQFINKNNSYYKIGESQIGVNIAKNFGDMLNGD